MKAKMIAITIIITLLTTLLSQSTYSAEAATDGVKMVAGGEWCTAILKTDGSLWMCGDNHDGQLGTGDYTDRTEPVQIMTDAKSVAVGRFFTAAIKTNGSLWCWGLNLCGQLGTTKKNKIVSGGIEKEDDSFCIPTPIQVMTNVKAVACGEDFMMAIKTDGSLWGWGSPSVLCDDLSDCFETVNGITVSKNYKPTKIMTNVKSVSIGLSHAEGSHVVVIKTDGSLWGWGDNNYGTLGERTRLGWDFKPKEIMASGVKAVSTSQRTTAILKTNGDLYMCGDNCSGQLGLGYKDILGKPLARKQEPVKVLSGIKAVSALDGTTLALKSDGSLLVFGYYGGKCILTPKEIVNDIAFLGVNTYAAVKTDGTLWYGHMW